MIQIFIYISICKNHFTNKFIFLQNKRLSFAIKQGDIEVAKKCLNLGADVNYMEVNQAAYLVSLNLVTVIYCCNIYHC